MIKKIIWVLSILSLGIVIFNNFTQTIEMIKINQNYLIALLISMIGGIFYGIVNLK